uniref:Uncharacterized protein n=1 Tax=Pseudonaja textilis TaxID=8673 RepID=A0A670YN04_PSETE
MWQTLALGLVFFPAFFAASIRSLRWLVPAWSLKDRILLSGRYWLAPEKGWGRAEPPTPTRPSRSFPRGDIMEVGCSPAPTWRESGWESYCWPPTAADVPRTVGSWLGVAKI